MNCFKILRYFQKGDKSLFEVTFEEQHTFLDSLGETKDDIDRGFKQYLCQNHFIRPRVKILFFNIFGAILLPLFIFYYLLKRINIRRINKNKIESIVETKGVSEVIPEEVITKYHPDEFSLIGTSLSIYDLSFIWNIIFHAPLHPYFVFKTTIYVAKYSDLICKYNPRVIIRLWEFSFCSSVLTAYCHKNGIKHIDVMHGEKLYNIRDSFFHFDECYVWSNHHIELFKSLRAEPSQFHIALPPSMKIDVGNYLNPTFYADYKYYLAIFSEDQIKSIVNSMGYLKQNGKTIKYRPHPRYSDLVLLKKYVYESEIEYPEKVSIFESVSNLESAVGSYSTVLSQAWSSGKNVIFDDVTFKDQYDTLSDLRYGLISQKCELLSSYQNSN
jgi:hypothetical protein